MFWVVKELMRRALILVVIAIVLTAILTHAAMMLTYSETRITAQGVIKTVGVEAFWDVACTDDVTAIDWGTLEPGTQATIAFYVLNRGNAPVTLGLSAEAWSPSDAQDHLILSWDYDGRSIDPGAAIPVQLTLTVAANITGIMAFSFQIVITAQG